ncbi:MAG: hypothetical protein Q4A49_05540 [Neisseria sp.]|nr:hypothetical protein [Neisseria sp.]
MKRLYLLACLTAVCTAQADTLYRCTSGKAAFYTDTPSQVGCTLYPLSGTAVLSFDTPAGKESDNAAPIGSKTIQNSISKALAAKQKQQARILKAAEQKARKAEAALERGKTVRKGGERNYARYRERIRKLEDAAENARNELEKLRLSE